MQRFFKSTRRSPIIIAALAVLTATAAGCGGSGDSSTTSAFDEVNVKSGSLTKAEFTKRANGVCTKVSGKLDKANAAFQKESPLPKTTQEQVSWVHELAEATLRPSYEEVATQLASLGTPANETGALTAYVRAIQARADEIEKTTNPQTTLFEESKSLRKAALAAGLSGCAESIK